MRSLILVTALLPAMALAQAGAPVAVDPAAAAGAPARTAQGDLSVTIYADQALVQDVRQIALPAGRIRQEFPDVSARIRPETVAIDVADAGVVEQNFDFDLLSPATLMEKAVGQTVTIVRTNPGSGAETREQAQVLAVNNGVVLRIGDRIEILRQDGDPVRVIFAKVPDNLRARPTLSVTLDSSRAATRPVSLRYLTPGLGWKADYVVLFDRAGGTLDMQGWVTLTNDTGTGFVNARTTLVAGAPAGPAEPPVGIFRPQRTPVMREAGTESAPRERLGDFYLYPLAARTTIASAQTKQVSFLDASAVPARATYEYFNPWLASKDEPESARSVLRFSTSRAGGLGDAMPAGTMRIYMKDARGAPQFIGENQVPHTPMGATIGVTTGDAFDIKVRPVVEERTRLSPTRWRTRMRYTLTNASPAAVTVDVAQQGIDWGLADTRLVEESLTSERPSSDLVLWHVPVPANGRAELTATFETRN